jgi:hypothetical protein
MTKHLDKAEAHTIAAIRRLEMMLWFIRNKKLSPGKHIPDYFDLVTDNLAAIQSAILSDDEYTQYVLNGLHAISKKHSYDCKVVADKDEEIFYDVEAMLPLKEMKQGVIFARRDKW